MACVLLGSRCFEFKAGRERFSLERWKGFGGAPAGVLLACGEDLDEIAPDVDDDPRAAYFKQVQFGVYVRMAAILNLLNIEV